MVFSNSDKAFGILMCEYESEYLFEYSTVFNGGQQQYQRKYNGVQRQNLFEYRICSTVSNDRIFLNIDGEPSMA